MSRAFYLEKLATLKTVEDKKCKTLTGETAKNYVAVQCELDF